jgi:predicted amidohydrolase
MRVAAYQAPLLLPGCKDAIELIRMQIRRCEIERIRILCCPEAILGGLADNHPEPSRFAIATHTKMLKNALALFVPTNNGLPAKSASAEVITRARKRDIATAAENKMWVIRADVAGNAGGLISFGSSGIVDSEGMVVQSARQMSEDLVVVDIDTIPRVRQRGKNTSRNHLSAMYSGSD